MYLNILIIGCVQSPKLKYGSDNSIDKYEIYYSNNPLDRCDQVVSELPFKIERDEWNGVAGYHAGPYCHGFTKYDFSKKTGEAQFDVSPVYLHIEKTKNKCSLEFAIISDPDCDVRQKTKCYGVKDDVKNEILFAVLKNQNASLKEGEPTQGTHFTPENFAEWCGKRSRRKYFGTPGFSENNK